MSEPTKPADPAPFAAPAGSALLPCQIPCPKCGSMDINRVFRAKGDRWKPVERPRSNAMVDVDRYEGICLSDCLTNHCRICQFDWETEPLPPNAQRERPAGTEDGR